MRTWGELKERIRNPQKFVPISQATIDEIGAVSEERAREREEAEAGAALQGVMNDVAESAYAFAAIAFIAGY